MSTFFTNSSLPNYHLEIDGNGVKVWVSLNIEPGLRKYLCHTNIFKAKKFWTYCLRVNIDKVNGNSIEQAYSSLLNQAMINIREAKKKWLDDQINILKGKSL